MASNRFEAGRLRERIKIQRENLVDNGRGGRVVPDGQPRWVDIAEAWAEVIPLRGGEALTAAALRSTQLYRVTIRRGPAFDTSARILWGDIAMNIRVIAPTPDRVALVMTAESGVPD